MGSISLFENGQALYHKAIGWADLEQRIKPTETTKYRIGSVTKTYTATVILQLVDENRLALDTKIDRYFPEMLHAKNITVAQLLRHHSGLNDRDYLKWLYYGKKFKQGKKAQYANCNYVLLAQIAEQIEQKPFSEIITERIFKPCQLLQTYYGNKPDSVTDEALSYIRPPRWQRVPTNDLNNSGGAGAVVSTPTEVNIFLNQLFSGHMISEKALGQMTTITDGYGCGLMQNYFKGKMAYSHSGAVDGFQTIALYFPMENFSLVYISNGAKLPLNDILILVLNIYFDSKE